MCIQVYQDPKGNNEAPGTIPQVQVDMQKEQLQKKGLKWNGPDTSIIEKQSYHCGWLADVPPKHIVWDCVSIVIFMD